MLLLSSLLLPSVEVINAAPAPLPPVDSIIFTSCQTSTLKGKGTPTNTVVIKTTCKQGRSTYIRKATITGSTITLDTTIKASGRQLQMPRPLPVAFVQELRYCLTPGDPSTCSTLGIVPCKATAPKKVTCLGG